MSEHVYSDTYTYRTEDGTYSNTYIFNCYLNGDIHVYQRLYNQYDCYSYLFTIHSPKYGFLFYSYHTSYGSIDTPAVTHMSFLSKGESIYVACAFYTGELHIYQWNINQNTTELYYSSSYHLSQPLFIFLSSTALYHLNTFGGLT